MLNRPCFTGALYLAKIALFAVNGHGREGLIGISVRSRGEVKWALLAKLSNKLVHLRPATPIEPIAAETVELRVPDFELIAQTGVAKQPRESGFLSNLGFAVFGVYAVPYPLTYKHVHVQF